MIKEAIVAAVALFTTGANAGEFSNCRVVEVVLTEGNNGHAGLDCDVSNRPTCAVAGSFIAFDKQSDSGKQWVAALLTAQATGARVSGMTTSTCSPYQQNVVTLYQLRVKH